MDDLKLPICPFSFKAWKVWQRGERIENVSGRLDWQEGFGEGRPHAHPTSGADGDVGVRVLSGENEEWIDGNAVNVENVLCTG